VEPQVSTLKQPEISGESGKEGEDGEGGGEAQGGKSEWWKWRGKERERESVDMAICV